MDSTILALQGLALYTEDELRGLFQVYSERTATDAKFSEFVENRFIEHPGYQRGRRYLWKADYRQALKKHQSSTRS